MCYPHYRWIVFQSLESLQAQEEARSKRHSTSELGTITFSDVRKEGWLHYKQILTEKGKVQHTARTHCELTDPSLIISSRKKNKTISKASALWQKTVNLRLFSF